MGRAAKMKMRGEKEAELKAQTRQSPVLRWIQCG